MRFLVAGHMKSTCWPICDKRKKEDRGLTIRNQQCYEVSTSVRQGGDLWEDADLYQLLAYATALDLPGGLLVYAQGETADAFHVVRHAGKRLEVAALGLAGTIGDLRRRIDGLAERVRRVHDAGLTASRAA